MALGFYRHTSELVKPSRQRHLRPAHLGRARSLPETAVGRQRRPSCRAPRPAKDGTSCFVHLFVTDRQQMFTTKLAQRKAQHSSPQRNFISRGAWERVSHLSLYCACTDSFVHTAVNVMKQAAEQLTAPVIQTPPCRPGHKACDSQGQDGAICMHREHKLRFLFN